MNEFYSSLDCGLRVSGMLADSIMMGIVNSAMEDAYTKSCSKEGDLVRLNKKSRFCELAIMQLEWCLRFLQEETNDNNNNVDREKLLSDLLETRDRIYNRLQETEHAIEEKDKELSDRTEIESDLRLALEVKDEDISVLHNALGLEREKTKRSKKTLEKIGGRGLDKLKSCVDQQIGKIRGKLEDEQRNLRTQIRKLSSRSLDLDKLIPEFDVDGEGGSCNPKDVNSKLMLGSVESLNLEIGYKEMVMDMDILKEKIDSSYKMMAGSVSLFKALLDEKRWIWNLEREIINVIIRGFLRDVQCKMNFISGISIKNFSPLLMDIEWSAVMDDITSLHDELEKLSAQKDMPPRNEDVMELKNLHYPSSKVAVGSTSKLEKDRTGLVNFDSRRASGRGNEDGRAGEGDEEASYGLGKVGYREGSSEDNPLGHSVAEIIRNHETIIRQKSQEIDCLKGELPDEKTPSALRSERSLDSVKEMITRVSSRMEYILKEKDKMAVDRGNHRLHAYDDKNSLHENFPGSLSCEKELEVIQPTSELPEQPNSRLCCHSIHAELCEEIKQLKQQKEDLDTKSIIIEETYVILFKGFIGRMQLEYNDHNIDTQIREDTSKVIFIEMVKEWSDDVETSNIGRLLMEETYFSVFSEVVKDIRCFTNVTMTNPSAGNLLYDNGLLPNSGTSNRVDRVQELDSLPGHFKNGDGLELDFNLKLVEPHGHPYLLGCDHEDSNKQDQPFRLVDENSKKDLQQLKSSKMQMQEIKSSVGLPLDEKVVPLNQVASVSVSTQYGKHSTCLPREYEERAWNMFQLIMMPLTEFSQMITDFELVACDKMNANTTRLEGLKNQIAPLVEQVNSIKIKETLYRKAFTRRCYDLQTAEAEVDLLGDEVDLLYGLVEKTYKVLNYYSPILEHYYGIMDVLKLIRKQLNGEDASTTKQ